MKKLKKSVPHGWKLEAFQGYEGETFTRAVDPDGCRWYDIDGTWRMNVPWFRRSPGLPEHAEDDLAVVDTTEGNQPYPIDKHGVIQIGRRRILPIQWDH